MEATLNSVLVTDCNKEAVLLGCSSFLENLSENLKVVCDHLENYKLNSEISAKDKSLLDSYTSILRFKIASLDGNETNVCIYWMYFRFSCSRFKVKEFWIFIVELIQIKSTLFITHFKVLAFILISRKYSSIYSFFFFLLWTCLKLDFTLKFQ